LLGNLHIALKMEVCKGILVTQQPAPTFSALSLAPLLQLGEHQPTPSEESVESRAIPSVHQKPVVILVVEDEALAAMALQRQLRALGYETPRHAVSGTEAIEKAAEVRPDLILMDIRLRGSIDGITAAAQIQQQLDVPVVYVTAYADQATIQQAHQETRCFGFLEKPYDGETLRRTIAVALDQHRGGR
jgi:CheY-like chemotaxis protein